MNTSTNPNEICRVNIEEQKDNICICAGLRVGSVVRLYHRTNINGNPDAIVVKYFDTILGFIKATDPAQTLLHTHSREGHKLVGYVTMLNKVNPTLPMIEIGVKTYLPFVKPNSKMEVPL